jgi:hypothetical protein
MNNSLCRTVYSNDIDGNRIYYKFIIKLPYETSDGMFACDLIFEPKIIIEKTTIFGVDAIDALDLTFEMLDMIIFEGDHGLIFQWPDGSFYLKSKISLRYAWKN